jgi:hypothetical protein
VHGYGHPLMMVVDAPDDLGQVRLDVPQRKHRRLVGATVDLGGFYIFTKWARIVAFAMVWR